MHRSAFILAALTLTLVLVGCQHDAPITEPLGLDSPPLTTLKLQSGDPDALDGGATLHGANGLALQADGRLLVGSLFGREIVEMAPADGTITRRYGRSDGVEGADDILHLADGTLIWSNFWTGHVVRHTAEGALTEASVGRGVGPLARHPDGRLFAARRHLGRGLYVLPGDLKSTAVQIADPGVIGGMVFGEQGRLWYTDWERGAVYRLDVDDPGAQPVQVAGGFATPSGLAFDAEHRLLVADHATGEVWRLDVAFPVHDGPDVNEAVKVRQRELLATLMPGLSDLVAVPGGHVYVANGQDGAVTKLYVWGGRRVVSPGGMILPGGVVVRRAPDGTEPLYVADAWTLRRFDRKTGAMTGVERCVMGVNGFTAPMTVSLSEQTLILSSWLGTVQVWDPDGCTSLAVHVYAPDVEIPLNAVRFGDRIVVAGGLSGCVFDVADRSVIADGFTTPAGMASRNGDLWVADRAAGEVWLVAKDGTPLPQKQLVADGLIEPEGLATLGDRYLVVVETGIGRVTRLDLATGRTAALADGLEVGMEAALGCPETWQFNGVSVGPDGLVYVTSDVTNRVYVITPPQDRGGPIVHAEP